MDNLRGANAIVTGASRGIGVYIARAGAFRYFELDSLIDMANLKVIERGIRLVNDGVDPATWGS